MGKRVIILCMIFLALAASGCSLKTETTEPGITGLIFQMENGAFLVVEGISDVNMPYDEWFEKGNMAVFFEVNDSTVVTRNNKKVVIHELEKGQKVEVWSTGALAKSYPAQGTAKMVNILED